jgi:hypothetical protein
MNTEMPDMPVPPVRPPAIPEARPTPKQRPNPASTPEPGMPPQLDETPGPGTGPKE